MKNQRETDEFLSKHIYVCMTDHVNSCLKKGVFDYSDIENIYNEEEDNYNDVMDWWFITEELYNICKRLGYVVLEKDGLHFWGQENTNMSAFSSFYDKIENDE